MTDGLLHKLSHGLGEVIVGCEKFMTFFNDLHNDSSLIPPLDPLMQVQKPTEMPKESCENQLVPWLSFLNILLATVMLGHSLYWLCRPLTWYCGYEFKRCCSLYLFVYDGGIAQVSLALCWTDILSWTPGVMKLWQQLSLYLEPPEN